MEKAIAGGIGLLALVVAGAGTAAAVTDAEKCEAAKLKIAGKYNFCRLKAEAKAVKTGNPADYSKCVEKYELKFSGAEDGSNLMCPTTSDMLAIELQVDADTAVIAQKLSGVRFIDNGDGTVSDTQTGLMWEKKDNFGGGANFSNPHDADNIYSWAIAFTTPNGTAYTDFLGQLNSGSSPDGTTISGCFAGHCDWRLPTSAELLGIVDLTAAGCGTGNPCIDGAFGPTVAAFYWSSTSFSFVPFEAWAVHFDIGAPNFDDKTQFRYVRAVRGGS